MSLGRNGLAVIASVLPPMLQAVAIPHQAIVHEPQETLKAKHSETSPTAVISDAVSSRKQA